MYEKRKNRYITFHYESHLIVGNENKNKNTRRSELLLWWQDFTYRQTNVAPYQK